MTSIDVVLMYICYHFIFVHIFNVFVPCLSLVYQVNNLCFCIYLLYHDLTYDIANEYFHNI